jgi:hypothetical protein
VPIDKITGDLVHRYWHEQMRINGGKMDKLARRDTLADHFYSAARSSITFFSSAPARKRARQPVAKLDASDNLVMLGPDLVTPDGYVVNCPRET